MANVAMDCYIEQVLTTIALTVAVLTLAVAISSARGPVSRARVAGFAARHQLVITPDNGGAVIGYLATTRRWRAAGLAGGVLASVAWTVPHGRVGANVLALLAGWFAGAAVAEARLARPPSGPRRAASLVARQWSDYLPGWMWTLTPIMGAIDVAVAAGAGIVAAAGRPVALWSVAFWAAAGLAVAAAVRVVQWRIVRRPQPPAAPDMLAADNAIRSRSLHVLSAAGATLVLYCVLGQLAAVEAGLGGAGGELFAAAAVVGGIVLPLVGAHIAARSWHVRRHDVGVGGTT